MDFNQSFQSYDSIEGANCQTTFGVRMTQKEGALEAVRNIGLNQIKPIEENLFNSLPQYYEMFKNRINILL